MRSQYMSCSVHSFSLLLFSHLCLILPMFPSFLRRCSYEQMNERGIKNIALNGGYLLCPQVGPSSIKILQFSTFLEKNPSMVLILTLKQMAGWSNNTFFISTWLKGPGSDTGASNTFIPCFSRRLG